MKTGKVNRKAFITALYTMLVFSVVLFAGYSKSYTKYIDKDLNALTYQVELKTLFKGESKTISLVNDGSSNKDLAHFKFSFNRNDVVLDNTRDVYTISLPKDACYFAENGISIPVNGTLDPSEGKITYQTKYNKNAKTNVDMYCYVDKIFDEDKNLNLSVDILEQVGKGENLESQFLYMIFSAPQITLDDYYVAINYDPTPVPPTDYFELIITDEEAKDKETSKDIFDDWIDDFNGKYGSDIDPYATETIKDYVDSVYKDKDIFDPENNLPGLSVTHEDGKYTFTIGANFIGYARTYKGHKEFNSGLMYYTMINPTIKDEEKVKVLKETMNYYLSLYYTVSDAQKIYTFIDKQNGFNKMLNHEQVIGLTYEYEDVNSLVLKLKSNILDYAYVPSTNDPFTVNFNMETRMYNYFIEQLRTYYGDIVSEDMIKYIDEENWEPYYDSITKNSCTNNDDGICVTPVKQSFTDYFVEYDVENGYYIIIKISSDVEANPDNNFNTVEVAKLSVPSGDFKLNITNNADGTITISMDYNDADAMHDVVDYLDNYFGQTSNLDDSAFTPDALGNIHISYNLINQVIR